MSWVRTYNPTVRLGNWFEDIALEEDFVKDFLEKREKGELLIQKTLIVNSLLNMVDLSVVPDDHIHFGDTVLVKCPGSTKKTLFTTVNPREDCFLSVNMILEEIIKAKKILGPCGVSGTKYAKPCLRTAFVIVSCDGTMNGQPLRYNQPFCLKTKDGVGGNLFLHSDRKTFQNHCQFSHNQEVTLTPEMSTFTKWRLQFFNPLLRLEYDYVPARLSETFIINHVYSNNNLAVEDGVRMLRTPYGTEYEISAKTYLDSHKAEDDRNHWTFITGLPEEPTKPEDTSEKTPYTIPVANLAV